MGKTYRDKDRAKVRAFNEIKYQLKYPFYRDYINSKEYQDSEVQLNSSLSHGVTYDDYRYGRRSSWRRWGQEQKKAINKKLAFIELRDWEPLNRQNAPKQRIPKEDRVSRHRGYYDPKYRDYTYSNVTPESKGCVHKFDEIMIQEKYYPGKQKYNFKNGKIEVITLREAYTTYKFEDFSILDKDVVSRNVCNKCKIIKR